MLRTLRMQFTGERARTVDLRCTIRSDRPDQAGATSLVFCVSGRIGFCVAWDGIATHCRPQCRIGHYRDSVAIPDRNLSLSAGGVLAAFVLRIGPFGYWT